MSVALGNPEEQCIFCFKSFAFSNVLAAYARFLWETDEDDDEEEDIEWNEKSDAPALRATAATANEGKINNLKTRMNF